MYMPIGKMWDLIISCPLNYLHNIVEKLGANIITILNSTDCQFQIDSNRCIPFPNCALMVKSKGISQWDTRRDICAWDAFALDEKVCFTALRSLKNLILVLSAELRIT